MASHKERHYWSQLRAALTSGQWSSQYPAKAYKGNLLTWSELFRKFNKHCRGYKDVAEIALQTQSLGVLLGAKYVNDDDDISLEDSEADSITSGKLDLQGECILQEERIEEAMMGYEILKSLESSNFDSINFVLAYYAYALGNPADCIAHLSNIAELLHFQNHIPTVGSTRSITALGLLTPSAYAPSTTSFSTSTIDSTIPEVRDGKGWAMVETFRSVCLQGMSCELLHPLNPDVALTAYRMALPLFSSLRSEFTPKSLPRSHSPAGKVDSPLFSQLREIWRWVERLLWRAIVISAKSCDVFIDDDLNIRAVSPSIREDAQNSLWTWLRQYTTCSVYWPPNFRSVHRSTICTIHLRALVLRYSVLSSLPLPGKAPVYVQPPKSSISVSSSSPDSITTSLTSRPVSAVDSSNPSITFTTTNASQRFPQTSWTHTARNVVQEYRAILSATTTFPRAGQRNAEVEEFVDLCVRVFEASGAQGEQAGWLIDILHWAQRLTFNCSAILRHLTRLLCISSSKNMSKRTLRLYIQVVWKAWEASKEGVGEDADEDARWVETLVFGVRMLCSSVGGHGGSTMSSVGQNTTSGLRGKGPPISDDGTEGIDDILEAHSMLEKAKTRLDQRDKRLVAEVLLAEGIVSSMLGVKEHDPLTRPKHFHKAHRCLLESVAVDPTPSAYYHLALSYARRIPRPQKYPVTLDSTASTTQNNHDLDSSEHEHDLKRAIESAGLAVEGAPKDVRYWHILGLLLTATEQWAAAKEVLETGAELDHDESEEKDEDHDKPDEGNNLIRRDGGEDSNGESEDANTVTNGTVHVEDFVPSSSSLQMRSPKKRKSLKGMLTPSSTSMPEQSPSVNGNMPVSPTLVLAPSAKSLPPASTLQHPSMSIIYPTSPSPQHSPSTPSLTIDQYPPSKAELFEWHLQLRMTRVALIEVMDGPEGAERGWYDVFLWIAEKRGSTLTSASSAGGTITHGHSNRHSIDGHTNHRRSVDMSLRPPFDKPKEFDHDKASVIQSPLPSKGENYPSYLGPPVQPLARDLNLNIPSGITISPATPDGEVDQVQLHLVKIEMAQLEVQGQLLSGGSGNGEDVAVHGVSEEVEEWKIETITSRESLRGRESLREREKEKKLVYGQNGQINKHKRSSSTDRGDTSKSKKVQQMLRDRVHKGRVGISAVSRKIGHGVARNGGLRRSTSTPDFHSVLKPTSYQASSIHSRRRLSSILQSYDRSITESPPPPPPPSTLPSSSQQDLQPNQRSARENRMLSDLWLMSAATFRRLGKIDQARPAIQEAEVKDESNPNVWTQLGLYYVALRQYQEAVDTLQKARFISPDDVSATVHLARLYLDPNVTSKMHSSSDCMATPPPVPLASSVASIASLPTSNLTSPDVDLAVGMLSQLTKGRGWDVPEAWFFLSKAYGMQGRKIKEKETLIVALELAEKRGVRDIESALGWCL